MKRVGNATHYHADYVAPYWSPTLVKVAVVGQHIFYRWTGGLGLPPAFVGRYAGGEMTGLQIATLDNLARGAGRPQVAAVATEGPQAEAQTSPVLIAVPAAPAPGAGQDEQLVTAQSAAADMVKAEDLDWQGRPRQKGPPRLARPSSMGASDF
jgi:hypothetical protein